ncbi:hypothetical protein Misp03_68060 [Microbispora sp. NBRC 16548]|nr:hypothetical protein Misp03_68060 [Microbispora sp. NBRC 16548]
MTVWQGAGAHPEARPAPFSKRGSPSITVRPHLLDRAGRRSMTTGEPVGREIRTGSGRAGRRSVAVAPGRRDGHAPHRASCPPPEAAVDAAAHGDCTLTRAAAFPYSLTAASTRATFVAAPAGSSARCIRSPQDHQ